MFSYPIDRNSQSINNNGNTEEHDQIEEETDQDQISRLAQDRFERKEGKSSERRISHTSMMSYASTDSSLSTMSHPGADSSSSAESAGLEGSIRIEGEGNGEIEEENDEIELELKEERASSEEIDIANPLDINRDSKKPPQKILREAIEKARNEEGLQHATIKIKSSLDQELRSDHPNFLVETEINSKGVLLYKVSVDFLVELKEGDRTFTLTLNRVFYSNASNEKEALLAIYHVAKAVRQQAAAPDEEVNEAALNLSVFRITYSRDPESKAVTGVEAIKGDHGIDVTPRASRKTMYGLDVDEKGQVRLRFAKPGEKEVLSREAYLLKAPIVLVAEPIFARLKRQKIDPKLYIQDRADHVNRLSEEFKALKEKILQDELLQWIFGHQFPPGEMQNYLQRKDDYFNVQQTGGRSREDQWKLEAAEANYADARVSALAKHRNILASLGRMQDIQSELRSVKTTLEALQAEIEGQEESQQQLAPNEKAMIGKTLEIIDKSLKDKELKAVETTLGDVFKQKERVEQEDETWVSLSPAPSFIVEEGGEGE